MSLPKNFNYQIYLSDLTVLFMVEKILPIKFTGTILFMVKNLNFTFSNLKK